MKKSYVLILSLLINSVFVKASDNNSRDILGCIAVTAATLALGHVLYSQEKDGAEQRAKGHIFTPTSGKDGRIAIPGEDALVRKAVDIACELSGKATRLPSTVIASPFYMAQRAGICTYNTYWSVRDKAEYLDLFPFGLVTIPVSGVLGLGRYLMFKTPTDELKKEYIAANPSEYLKQVRANNSWFTEGIEKDPAYNRYKDLDGNLSDETVLKLGLKSCNWYGCTRFNMLHDERNSNYEEYIKKTDTFCYDIRDLVDIKARNS